MKRGLLGVLKIGWTAKSNLSIIIISFVEYPGVPSFWLIEFTWLNPQGVL